MKAVIWSKPDCPYCVRAKYEFDKRGIAYEERKIGDGWTKEQLLEEVPNARTIPQIVIDGKVIGGYTELMKSGKLDF
jgi:glutaredoxin 3